MGSSRWFHWMLAALLSGLLVSGCSSFSPEEPPIPDSTFVRVLTEFHLASARAQTDQDSLPGVRDSILARYGVDETHLQAAIDYYSERPAAYESLYDAVLDSLSAYESELRRPLPSGQP